MTYFVEDDPLFPLMAKALSEAYSAGDPDPQDPEEEWGHGAALCVRVAREKIAELEAELGQARNISAMQDDEIHVLKLALADWKIRAEAREDNGVVINPECSPAYGGCACDCHRCVGVKHFAPCCYPGEEATARWL